MTDDGNIRTIGERVTPFGLDIEEALQKLEDTRAEILAGKVGWMGIVCVPPLERMFHEKTLISWNRWTSHHTALIASIAGAISFMQHDFLTNTRSEHFDSPDDLSS